MKHTMRRLMALLLTLVLVLSVMPMVAMAQEPVLELGTQDVTFEGTDCVTYSFTAPSDGQYRFFSNGEEDVYVVVSDDEGVIAENDDNGDDRDFFVQFWLEKDQEIAVEIYLYNGRNGATTVTVDMLPTITLGTHDVTVDGIHAAEYTFTAPQSGEYRFYSAGNYDTHLYLNDREGNTIDDDNDSLDGNNFELILSLEEGEMIAVVMDCYYGGTVTFSTTIELVGEPQRVLTMGTQEVTVNGTEHVRFTFIVPEDSWYSVSSSGDYDTYAALYDADDTLIAEDTDSGEEGNFDVRAYLQAGQQIQVELIALLSGELTFSVTIEKVAPPTPEITVGTHDVTVGEESVLYKFYAPDQGFFLLYSAGDYDTVATVYNENMSVLVENDDGGERLNFRVPFFCTQGTLYYIEIRSLSGGSEITFPVTLKLAEEASELEVFGGEGSLSLALLEMRPIDYVVAPEDAYPNEVDFESTNAMVAAIDRLDSHTADLHGAAAGEATITVTVDDRLTQSVDVTVRLPIAWDITKPQTVYLSPRHLTQTLNFTVPANGYYLVESTNAQMFNQLYAEADGPNIGVYTTIAPQQSEGELWVYYLEKNTPYYLNTTAFQRVLFPYVEYDVTLTASDLDWDTDMLAFSEERLTASLGGTVRPSFVAGEEAPAFEILSQNEEILAYGEESDVFVAKAVGEATLAIRTEDGVVDTLTVTVIAPSSIEENTRVPVAITHGCEHVFTFTPEADGEYLFRSYGDMDPYIALFDENGEFMGESDDEDGLNFRFASQLKGGKTYRIHVSVYDTKAGTFELDVQKAAVPTSVTVSLGKDCYIRYEDKTYYVQRGVQFWFETTFGGENAKPVEVETIVGDPEILLYGFANTCGQTTLTVRAESGISDTITIVVVDTIFGDLNTDGKIDRGDVTFLKACINGEHEIMGAVADVNGDCVVNAADVAWLYELLGIGDVNDDGKINTTDARVVLQYAAGVITADALDVAAADTNGDGKVNTTDARVILQYCAGLISEWV